MGIGDRIRQFRLEKHLSQEALAQQLDVSRQAVTKWECNQAMPSTANLLALCKVLGVPMDALTENGEAKPGQVPEKGKHRPMALLVSCIVLTVISLMIGIGAQMNAVPADVIGYADAETGIVVAGMPVYLYLLYGVNAILVVVTVVAWVRSRHYKKG